MSNKPTLPKIIHPYGPKISGCTDFKPDWDTTGQRAPINDIQELYNTFMNPADLEEEIREEMDSEKIEDFDDDIYDYDDRSEFGEDVAASQQAPLAAAARRLAKRQKANRAS